MNNRLNNTDYISILQFYKISIPKTKNEIRKLAEDIMATKLCRCIKKIGVVDESKSIGICTKTIFNSKGFTRGKFNCKNNLSVDFVKTKKSIMNRNKRIKKTNKNITKKRIKI